MYKYSIMLITLSFSFASINSASDRPQDVENAYNRDKMRLMNREAMSISKAQELNMRRALEEVCKNAGGEMGAIMTEKKFLQRQEEFNTKLYHALNAALSHIRDYLQQAQNDESLEWTHRQWHGLNQQHGIDDSTDRIVQLSIPNGKKNQLYLTTAKHECEILRQTICLEFTFYQDLFMFWKNSIFPCNTIQSYSSCSAHALDVQIRDLIERYKSTFGYRVLLDEQNIEPDYFPFAIQDMLHNIYEALPKVNELGIPLNKSFKSQDIALTKDRNNRIINSYQKEYWDNYNQFCLKFIKVHKCLGKLRENPFISLSSRDFFTNFKDDYKKFQYHRFPNSNGKMKFGCTPLNFKKLLPDIVYQAIGLEEKLIEMTPESRERFSKIIQHIVKELGNPPLSVISIRVFTVEYPAADAALETGDKDEAVQIISTTSRSQENNPIINEAEHVEEIVTYDQNYWQAEHQRHLERKAAMLSSTTTTNTTLFNVQLVEYANTLDTFLKEQVYRYTTIKVRDFKKKLKELKFKVVVNKSGKGSVHYLMPTPDNPLFGADENYAGAYFNVHLPHDDGDIIPAPYFTYIKSGFANIFGLIPNEKG